MAKVTAIGLARDMIRGRDETILTPKQADFLRSVCQREMDNLIRRKERQEYKKGPDSRRFPVVASVGDVVWREGSAYYVNPDGGLDGECYVVCRPFPNGYCKLARSDWKQGDWT